MSGLTPIILIQLSGFIGPEGKIGNPNDNFGFKNPPTGSFVCKAPVER